MYAMNPGKLFKMPLWMKVAIVLLVITPVQSVFAEYHHVDGCMSCHNFFAGGSNLYLIQDEILTPASGPKPVVFTAMTGPGSFADGDAIYDGVCEVCHTQTRHHRNDGSDYSAHFDGESCIQCHDHTKEFTANFSKSHEVHISANNRRRLDCVDCHETTFTQQNILFTDGETFANTGVCDRCHSPRGNYDGVNDPLIGAKSNWANGVYDANHELLPGKEMWCAGCHDRAPSHARNNNWCMDCHNVDSNTMFR